VCPFIVRLRTINVKKIDHARDEACVKTRCPITPTIDVCRYCPTYESIGAVVRDSTLLFIVLIVGVRSTDL